MPFALIDGVIANETFASPAAPRASQLVDGINQAAFDAAAAAWANPDWMPGLGMVQAADVIQTITAAAGTSASAANAGMIVATTATASGTSTAQAVVSDINAAEPVSLGDVGVARRIKRILPVIVETICVARGSSTAIARMESKIGRAHV